MMQERYEIKGGESLMVFEFVSEGPKGKINKMIRYEEIEVNNLFNLSFGDKSELTGDIDDMAISNNNDTVKILNTVVSTVYTITDMHPDAWIHAAGSTPSRTRLYRMGLTKYLDQAEKDFILYGQKDGEWEIFVKDRNYEGFLVHRKNQ